MKRTALGLATTAIAGLAVLPAVVATPASAAVYGPDTCVQGYVWREARPSDHVCVTPAVRTQAAQDNSVKASRWTNGAYGPHTCIQGYVWREAFTGDDVCVTPAARSQAQADNAAAASRLASSSSLPSPIAVNRNVTFSGGVPVGGWTSLTLYDNGTYQWSGHMHDSGATSYNVSGVCVVRLSSGSAFVFETSGRLHGTFESGSRDHNWSKSGTIPSLPTAWRASSSYTASCKNNVTLNLAGTVDAALEAVGYASAVIAIVA
ncbi:hypothetical protein [Microtetraspora malaysiensis]|uniref:hypothetical protein n=1 Tax=Microtetraspora malaysiensis TaxID=161358 RepID=UPI00082BD79C|nr:hypothetical protein [Microtetraspora malaysiensis]